MSPDVLDDIDLDLPNRRAGKVRVVFDLPDERLLMVTTDRLSAFDRHIASIPRKGQVLNQLAAWWFDRLADVVPNHLLSVPDPNVSVVTATRPLPVEVIVRGHITGVTSTSLWTRYHSGERRIDGHRLPDGLRKNQMLANPIVTPTTKAELGGHDEPLSCDEVVTRGLVDATTWATVVEAALEIFDRGRAVAAEAGLVLADTKYEFGLDPDGRVMLIDEVHTPDSSRFWIAETYTENFERGSEPESLDKEIVRRALADAGFTGDGPVLALTAEQIASTSQRYVQTYERITGVAFRPGTEPIAQRVRQSVHEYLRPDTVDPKKEKPQP